MLAKYRVEFGVSTRNRAERLHYETDDPVACEEVLSQLLERDFKIFDLKHDGLSLPRPEFDRMIKAAASMLAARHVCASLDIKSEEERFRFGFAA